MKFLIEATPWWLWSLIVGYAIYAMFNWLIITEKNTHWLWRLILGTLCIMFLLSFVMHRMILETGYLKEYVSIIEKLAIPIAITFLVVCGFYPRSAPISEERKRISRVMIIFGGSMIIVCGTLLAIMHYYDWIISFFK